MDVTVFLEEHFFIDHQDSEESEDEEGITYEELKKREGYSTIILPGRAGYEMIYNQVERGA